MAKNQAHETHEIAAPSEPGNVIILKQLPIIEERLAALSEQIKSDVQAVVALEVTDETVKQVKAMRAKLNNDFKALENERIRVKKEVMAPYEAFEEAYKKLAADQYKDGLADIDARVNVIEGIQIQQKKAKLKEYYDELCLSVGVDFVPMERWDPKIGLSSSLTSLKKQADSFISGIADCLHAVDDMENRDEILVEYKQSLNFANAIQTVKNRHAAIEEQKQKKEEAAVRKKAETKAVAKVDAALPQPTIEALAPPQPAKTIVSVNFYSTTTGEVYPREYSYYCDFPVEVGQKVEVETQKGTSKAVISAVGVDPASIKFDISLMKNVIAVIRDGEEAPAEKDPDEWIRVTYDLQRRDIRKANKLFEQNGIEPKNIRWEAVNGH